MRKAVIVVAAITVLGGVGQAIAAAPILRRFGEPSPEAVFLFRLASVFEGLFGCAILHAVALRDGVRPLCLWGGVQKFAGACFLITRTSASHGPAAAILGGVAAYDVLAGICLLWYGRHSHARRGSP